MEKKFGEVVSTDVSLNAATSVVCDGHDLPFKDEQFDFVILTAVLEHVADPVRVVSEVERVLKQDGIVYAVTPFMQQVHMGAYDFTRFTDLGHRWLFRSFAEIERGTCGGPASSLVWSLMYFCSSLVDSKKISRYLGIVTRCAIFWIKYADFWLEKGKRGSDGANGYFFVGRRNSLQPISLGELITLYRGQNR